MEDEEKGKFTGILTGWDHDIKMCYDLRHSITSKLAARAAYKKNPDLPDLFGKLFKRIEGGLRPDIQNIGKTNWELIPEPNISEHNESLEKRLEKQIAKCAEKSTSKHEPMFGWSNQVPAASGYKNPYSNRKNSIDLVCEIEPKSEYAFIELKVHYKSGSPFYATFEILSYGFLYLLTRTNAGLQKVFESFEMPALNAKNVRLIVLAPNSYYESDKKSKHSDLKLFESEINKALTTFAREKLPELKMSFEFSRFPDSQLEDIPSFKGFAPGPYGELLPDRL